MDFVVKEHSRLAVQQAIDAAHGAGGGRVVLEPGVYRGGSLWLQSNVELHLSAGARLVGSSRAEDYDDFDDPRLGARQPENSRKFLIGARDAENIAITGPGEINGSGPEFYDRTVQPGGFYAKPAWPRPRMVQFFRCRNVRLEDANFIDSPGWTMWLIDCHRVCVHGIHVAGDQRMINNDGLDIDGCSEVTVSDSFFRTGDDCLILRAIRRNPDEPVVCENVAVTNCVLDSRCQGIRVGCPSDDTIRHCRFSNLVIRGEGNGININNPRRYLAQGCSGYMDLHDVTFDSLTIESTRIPVWINVEAGIRLRRIQGIVFSNLTIAGPEPCRIDGCAETIPEDIHFSNVRFRPTGDGMEFLHAHHCRNLRLDQMTLG